jgi:tetratricopeptide (TPR) repeat protein
LSVADAAFTYQVRGNAYHTKGRDDLAIADYTVALKNAPEPRPEPSDNGSFTVPRSAILYNLRGEAYRTNRQEELAITDYTTALGIQPKWFPPYYGRALALFALGRFGESALDFKRRIDRSASPNSVLWFHVARIRSGDNDDELEVWNSRLDATMWPAPIFGLYLGRLTPDQALSAASTADTRCAAAFHVAEWQLWHHEIALARSGFAQALETCPRLFPEYQGAQAELARLPK